MTISTEVLAAGGGEGRAAVGEDAKVETADGEDMKDPAAWVRNLRRSRIRDL